MLCGNPPPLPHGCGPATPDVLVQALGDARSVPAPPRDQPPSSPLARRRALRRQCPTASHWFCLGPRGTPSIPLAPGTIRRWQLWFTEPYSVFFRMTEITSTQMKNAGHSVRRKMNTPRRASVSALLEMSSGPNRFLYSVSRNQGLRPSEKWYDQSRSRPRIPGRFPTRPYISRRMCTHSQRMGHSDPTPSIVSTIATITWATYRMPPTPGTRATQPPISASSCSYCPVTAFLSTTVSLPGRAS